MKAASPADSPSLDAADLLRIVQVMERLAGSRDLGEILKLIVDSMRDCLRAERASVLQYDAAAHQLFATAGGAHGVDESLRFSADAGLAGEALRSGSIISVPDCYADARFNRDIDRQTGFRTRCMLSVPLVSFDGRAEGVAQVLNKVSGGAFDARDEVIARALASQAAVALRRARLIEAEIRKEKMEADLRVARDIQVASLPRRLPEAPGWELAASSTPAEETGGDAYDVIVIGDSAARQKPQRLLLLMADAAGHGVGPALSVAQAVAMIRMAAMGGSGLHDVLRKANALLRGSLPVGRFVAAIACSLDLESGRLEFVAAGQAPLLILRAGGSVEERPASAPPLGIDDDLAIDAAEPVTLSPGDALVLLSDGYLERMNPRGEQWGSGGAGAVKALLGERSAASAAELLAALDEAAARHAAGRSAEDDQTALVVRRKS